MNTKSVRFRLTVWYTLAFSAAAAAIFIIFYIITRQSFFFQTDSALASHTESIVNIVKRQGLAHQMMIKEVYLSQYSQSPGMLVVLMDDTGNIVSSSIPVEQTAQIFNKLFEKAKEKKKPVYQDDNFSKIPMRYYIYPVYDREVLQGVVLMAHPMDIIQQSLSQLLLTLEVVFVIFLIPTVLGGYLLARSGLQPISSITGKLREISSENLTDRIVSPKTGDEIEELAHTFNNLLDRLHQAFTRERQFIADVAHELKTPLSTFRSSIEVALSKRRSNEEYKKVLSETIIDIDRLSKTLTNILDLAWVTADGSNNKDTGLNFSKLVEELKEFTCQMANPKSITVEGDIVSGIRTLGIKDKLERSLLNILDNAVKYTLSQGKILITLQKIGHNAVLIVKDNGIGIDKRDLPHIFKRFYRGSNTDRSLGSGLGLSIAQAIIWAHRGKIEVKSTKGQGTTVRVTLPCVDKYSKTNLKTK